MRITILGAGSWGTALAALLGRRHDVMLWSRRPEYAQSLKTTYQNKRYLPGIELPRSLHFCSDLQVALAHTTQHTTPSSDGINSNTSALILLAVPLSALRVTLEQVVYNLNCVDDSSAWTNTVCVWTCKGISNEGLLLPHQIADEVMGDKAIRIGGVVSGPSFALEVAQGLPVALTVASASMGVCQAVTEALHGSTVRVYRSHDVIGVEVGGAVKNVLAIACGVCDGLALGHNARAALITRGLAEMARLGVALGAKPETFMGLTGLGDLILTATGDLSRNRRLGMSLAAGQNLQSALNQLGQVAEGVNTAMAINTLANTNKIDMPVTQAVYRLLHEGLDPRQAVLELLARGAKTE